MTAVSDARVRTKSIVVGIIGDRYAGSLAYALQVALAESASVRIVRVSPSADAARRGLQLPIHTLEVVGDPVAELVRESRDADLLVVEAPHDPLAALTDPLLVALRRATQALLVEVSCDGEIVRASGAEGWEYEATSQSRFAMPPAGPVTERFICVGVDSSPASDAAVEWAAAMAERTAARLTLVSVFDHAGGRRTEQDASTDVAAAGALVTASVPTCVVTAGEVAESLLEAARGAEMLVVGRHSTSGLIHSALASVGDTCGRLAACPVVIVPQGRTGARSPGHPSATSRTATSVSPGSTTSRRRTVRRQPSAGDATSGPSTARIVAAARDQRAVMNPWPDVSVVATDHSR